MTQYCSKTLVEAFQWFPNCELPEWFGENRLQSHQDLSWLWFDAYDDCWKIISEGDFIVKNGFRVVRLSPADFAQRYEVGE